MEFFAKKKQLVDALDKYCKEVDRTIDEFVEMANAYFEGKTPEEVEEYCKRVRKCESKCDEYRRDIEHQLYGGAMMPGSRGDIFMLLESLDKVPNKAEDTANFIALVGPEVPKEYHEDMGAMLQLTVMCTKSLTNSINKMFKSLKKAHNEAHDVENIETEIDKLERQLIRRVFNSDLSLSHKMMIRELVVDFAAISDRAEDASDRVEIMAIKRKT
jgi:uncharacterized protein